MRSDRIAKLSQGEYAAISTNANDLFGSVADGRLAFPTVQSTCGFPHAIGTILIAASLGASGEAAFMTGLERNSDIVFAASYAPLLQVRHLVTTSRRSADPRPSAARQLHSMGTSRF